jgi:hypothetical protein
VPRAPTLRSLPRKHQASHVCDLQVKNIGAGRLELNYCIPVLQQPRFGDKVHAGLQIGLGTEFL